MQSSCYAGSTDPQCKGNNIGAGEGGMGTEPRHGVCYVLGCPAGFWYCTGGTGRAGVKWYGRVDQGGDLLPFVGKVLGALGGPTRMGGRHMVRDR